MIRNTFRVLHRKHATINKMFSNFCVSKSNIPQVLFASREPKPYTDLSINQRRNIQLYYRKCVKRFTDTENAYCYNILESSNLFNNSFKVCGVNKNITDLDDFNKLLDKNYRVESIEQIVQAFKDALKYCVQNNINISDTRFDNLVDGLMDNCEYLTDELLYDLLQTLSDMPQSPALDSHNFHDVWSCLDDICCWKMHGWDVDTTLLFASAWFKLNLGKVSDYVFESVQRLAEKSQHLTKNQILQTFFYLNVCRKQNVDFYLEDAAARYIKEMTADEMAIIALGFFKSQSKVKISEILEEMMNKVMSESNTINEITLTAILKVIRLSKQGKLVHIMNQMLDKLTFEIDRLSHLACLHIALVGTSIQALHKKSLHKVTEKLSRDIQHIDKVRLKDIERLLMALTMFDIDSKDCFNFYEKAYKELHNEARSAEAVTYNRSVPLCLYFLSLRNIYSYEHLSKVLDADYITAAYGKTPKMIPLPILSLNASIDIECPDYKGNRLSPEKKYRATKWNVEFVPSHEQYTRLTPADKFFLETVDILEQILKNKKLIHQDHVLPHFSKADIILCKDTQKNIFVEPFGFENYILGDVKYPVKNKNLKWYALIVVGWNNTLRGSSIPLGHMMMKKRQLSSIGYKPAFVIWNEFILLPKEAKIQYLCNKLL